jgi:hypothetical protein
MARVLQTEGDETRVTAVDANGTEVDILLKGELERFEKETGVRDG